MYRFSRALFLEIKDLVDPHPDTSRPEARRIVLTACERTVERLARDRRYFTRPTRSLFDEIRHLFPLSQHARVYFAIERTLELAKVHIQQEYARANEANARCRATTRKGHSCQRTPLPSREYCPSHAHLEEPLPVGAAA
jgi:hypothetical protein